MRALLAEAPAPQPALLYGQEVERRRGFRRGLGRARLAAGSVRVRELATGAAEDFGYGALHCGDPHLTAGVRPLRAVGDGGGGEERSEGAAVDAGTEERRGHGEEAAAAPARPPPPGQPH